MAHILQVHEELPLWQPVVTASTNAVVGASVTWLLASSVTVLQSGAISAVSNLVASVFTVHVFGDPTDSMDDRVPNYIFSHLVAVPLVALAASWALGWSISIPAVLLLTVTNAAASILGVLAAAYIRDACQHMNQDVPSRGDRDPIEMREMRWIRKPADVDSDEEGRDGASSIEDGMPFLTAEPHAATEYHSDSDM